MAFLSFLFYFGLFLNLVASNDITITRTRTEIVTDCPKTDSFAGKSNPSRSPSYSTITIRSTRTSTVSTCPSTVVHCTATSSPYITTIVVDVSTIVRDSYFTNSEHQAIASGIATTKGGNSTISSSSSNGFHNSSASFDGTQLTSSTVFSATSSISKTSESTSALSSTQIVSSASTSTSNTQTSSVPSEPAATTPIVLFANTPADLRTNGYYGQVISGSLSFTATDAGAASDLYLDSSGHLIYNGLYGQITPGTVSQVQFVNPVTALTRRQTVTTPVVCTVFADGTGASTLTCSASGQAIAQSCGTSFYLGSTNACEPLIIGYIKRGDPTTGVPPIISTPGTASASFEIAFGTSGTFAIYAASPPSNPGFIQLYFTKYGSGPVFNLDASGHLVSIGPTSTGSLVPYVAVFPIGSTLGPLIEMTGVIPSGYVAIVCALQTNAVTSTTTLSCTDGADGSNMVLQGCGSNLALSLGTVVGTGCSLPSSFRAVFPA